MAFTKNQFKLVSGANSLGGKLYMYEEANTIALISVSGYFDTAALTYNLTDEDLILIIASDGFGIYQVNVTTASPPVVTLVGGIAQGANIVSLTAAKTLTAADSGKTFILEAAAGVAITLPSAAYGLKYKFMNGEITTTSVGHIISATAGDGDNIKGVVTTNGALNATTGCDVITFTSTVALAGDYCEIESDGVNWYVSGTGSAATSIAFS